MKKVAIKFLLYFLVFFGGNLIINIFFKSQADFLTAFSTAFGVAFGIAAIELYTRRKSKTV
ncbi:hypothetical protein [Priestia aryabhattai]|uniref:hypothetical protein n=1 Tax=Priestia aryabhattai TaxID=412384 RepID=UPI0015F5991B|nr:hypothetical protein [Priestia aryabhattai]